MLTVDRSRDIPSEVDETKKTADGSREDYAPQRDIEGLVHAGPTKHGQSRGFVMRKAGYVGEIQSRSGNCVVFNRNC